MFGKAFFGAVALIAGGAVVAVAGPKDDVVAAAKKLNEAGNYSWRTVNEAANGGFGSSTSEGKTQKDGLTYSKTTMGDNTTESVRLGEKGAVKNEDGWVSLEEARQGGGGRGFFGAMGQGAPAAQLVDTLAALPDLQKSGDTYTASVTGDAVRAMMPFGRGGRGGRGGQGGQGGAGGNPPPLQNAKASVKIWLKDGMVSKYEVHTAFTINFNGEDREFDTTRTTEIKDVGSTKVEIPAEAKAKMQ